MPSVPLPPFLGPAVRPVAAAMRRLLGQDVEYVRLDEIAPPGSLTTLLPATTVPTPETASMAFEAFNGHLKRPAYTAPPVRSLLHSGLRYCPTNHCLLTEEGAVVRESTGPGARPVPLNKAALERPVTRVPGVAVPLRCFFNDFYHLLVDNLARFDLLNFDHFRQFSTISVLCPGGPTEQEAFFLNALMPPNVRVMAVPKDTLYEPDQCLVNTFVTSRSSGYLRGPYVERLRARLGLTPPGHATERILISRRHASRRRIQNEDELLTALRPLGFQRCVAEDLALADQIALFSHAEAIIAPHGAGLSHLLFAPQARVLELFASPYVVPHYYLLAKSLGQPYAYLTGTQPHHDDDFTVNVDAAVRSVRELLASSRPNAPSSRPS